MSDSAVVDCPEKVGFMVRLPKPIGDALVALARRERRTCAAQAQLFIEAGMREAARGIDHQGEGYRHAPADEQKTQHMVRLPEPLAGEVRALARRQYRTLSAQVQMFIEAGLRRVAAQTEAPPAPAARRRR